MISTILVRYLYTLCSSLSNLLFPQPTGAKMKITTSARMIKTNWTDMIASSTPDFITIQQSI